MSSIYDWSTTAASNASSDALINWAEGQAPSTVNGSSRQEMGRVAEFVKDIGGALTAGGTANALTVTANSAFTAYADGLVIALRIATDNSAAATLNVNGLGAKSIRKMLAAGESALVGAELQATGIYILMYSAALNSAAGGWLLLNPTIDLASFATLTGIQTLTNKTLTSPVINTPTLTGGTSASMTITGAALNGTLGATTPSTVAGTTGDFSSIVTAGRFTSSQTFEASVATVILASTGAGTVSLRPNGRASSSGEMAVASTGDVTISGSLTVSGSYQGAPNAVMEDRKTSGTSGGTTVATTWTTHALNTEARDPSGLVSISANQFTPTVAGWVEWEVSAFSTTIGTRLQNMTGGTTVGQGTTAIANTSPNTGAISVGGGAVAAGNAYAIQYYAASAVADGLGQALSQGSEVYARVKFYRT